MLHNAYVHGCANCPVYMAAENHAVSARVILCGQSLATRVAVLDCAGDPRFRVFAYEYVKSVRVVLIVFAATSRQSFESVGSWAMAVRQHSQRDPIVGLVCTTTYAEEPTARVPTEEARAACRDLGLDDYFEVDARDLGAVSAMFEHFAGLEVERCLPRDTGKRREQAATLAMGTHVRLGSQSPLAMVTCWTVMVIAQLIPLEALLD
eukprot:m51a1_g5921 putative rab family gtpase (207) ;mRNA; f:59668-60288